MMESRRLVLDFAWLVVNIMSFSLAKNCDSYEECFSCTSHDCKWCPLDDLCYNQTFLANTGHCGREESKNCENRLFEAYDATTAYENILLTAAANTNKSNECLKKLFPQKDYQIVATISVPCDILFTYPNCYAYVAVTHSKKKIIIAYRGTKNIKQLIEEVLLGIGLPKVPFEAGGRVQVYFLNAHLQLYGKIRHHIEKLKTKYPDYRILVLGHSLGGAMASLASASLVYENITQSDTLTLYTFGMPRVGNQEYARAHDRLVPNSYRLVHHRDIVTHLPPCGLFCSKTTSYTPNTPYHHGKEVFYLERNMTLSSKFKLCRGDEDSQCSNGLIKRRPCLIDISACIQDHKYYFGVGVSVHCQNILL